jgi:DNA recombination-dependent growth factor C
VGFLSASTSVVRFVAAAPSRVEREAIAQAVTRHAFREAEVGDPRYTSGWITMHDPLLTTFTPTDLFFHQYLVVGFRFDTRLVPPKLLMLERRRLERERAEARGVQRIPAAERKEIKEEIASRLIAQALPSPRLLEVVWNLETGRVYFSGKVRAAREAFAECFRRTFGVTPVPLIPYLAAEHVGLGDGAVQAVRAAEPSSLIAAAPAADTPAQERAVAPAPVGSGREEELFE